MKLRLGQSVAALGISLGCPISGVASSLGASPFVNADVPDARLGVSEPCLTGADDLVGGISHPLIVHSPPAHQAVRVLVHLCGKRDGIALPCVRFVLVNLILDEVGVADAGVEQSVGQQPGGTGNLVDEVSNPHRLGSSQHLSREGFLKVLGRTSPFSLDGYL